jgi:hypothetical protein
MIVFFHELYALGKPWQSSYWLSPIQRHIVTSFGRLCDRCFVTRTGAARWLEERGGVSPQVCALPSTVGEPIAVRPFHSRERVAVVFGSTVNRAAVYAWNAARLARLLQDLGIREIWDVGPGVLAVTNVGGIPVVSHGALSREQVSAKLATAQIGILRYPMAFLAKSSVYASYAAHSVAPLVIGGHEQPANLERASMRLTENLSLPTLSIEALNSASAHKMAAEAGEWYRREAHSSRLVSAVAKACRE